MNRGHARRVALIKEGFAMVRSNVVASALIATIVALISGAVLATTGQTAVQEAAVLSTIDEAGTRTVLVREGSGGPGFDRDALSRIVALSGVESAIGLGQTFDVRNDARSGGGEPIPTRVVFGGPNADLVVTRGRWPRSGEATVGDGAIQRLGLVVPSGAVSSVRSEPVAVVGSFVGAGPFAGLANGVLVGASPGDTTMRLVIVVASAPEEVEALTAAVVEVLAPDNRLSLRIETSEQLASVRQAVQGELGRFSRELVVFVLAGGLVLTTVTVLSSVTLRRRDFGRRRVLGASRSAIVVLVLTQTAVSAVVGGVVGTVAGLVIVRQLADAVPPWSFVISVGTLALLAALVAAMLPALLAARRDPVRVLRVP